tara:strand:- start:69482 stop:70198 length:717 start_codon:yes stop_codon:yes gene_type:complete
MNHSIIDLFLQAGIVVKLVMILLLIASVLSWAFILQRWQLYRATRKRVNEFEEYFWSGIDVNEYYQQLYKNNKAEAGINNIFTKGFREYKRLAKNHANIDTTLEGIQRAMRVAINQEQDSLERHLPFLATVGSTSPYVGLFGTVWGIMTAFSALSSVQQATISMVAPGISEALVATAIGLFAAIPAVIAYNRFSYQMERILTRYESFAEEFTNSIRSQLLDNALLPVSKEDAQRVDEG